MIVYLRRRLWHAAIVFALVNTLTFALVRLAPGLPQIMTGDTLTNADRMQFRHNLGLDKPILEQYFLWWSHVLRGDLGTSWTEHTPVLHVLLTRLPNTLILAACAMLISSIIGITAGVLSAVYLYSPLDYAVTSVGLFGLAVPSFWLGLMLILLFSVHWQLLPSAGMYTLGGSAAITDRLTHLILPTLVLAAGTLAQIIRFTRSSLVDILGEDYIRTARAKGLPERIVLLRHGLRNALIPVITVLGLQLPRFIGGSIIVESIFAWPGVGRLAYSAALTRDYPMIMGVTILISVVVLGANLVTDIAYTVVDPRIRFE
ncbi:MAG TPA: ABC transporter permease [Thermomicrobiaceae bacterium]|nr:ABC transporter permease [Thermomicrobiaceae bacterium]